MDAALIASALMLGLAGSPHCTAMCGAPCAAAVGRGEGAGGAAVAFHAARIAGYAAAGAVAAASVGAVAAWSQVSPMVKPLWTLLHAAAFALGLYLLVTARQPAFMGSLGRSTPPLAATAAGPQWQVVRGPRPSQAVARGGAAGLLWVAWPCGLLQSALVIAALANHAAGGAAVMGAFAVASSAGLVFAPWLWIRLGRIGGAKAERLAVRSAGVLLAAMSGWALTHGLWETVAAFCATP